MGDKIYKKWVEIYSRISLRYVIWGAFTITSIISAIMIGVSFYNRFSIQLQETVEEQNRALIKQVDNTITSNLRTMMKISDTLYFSVFKDADRDMEETTSAIRLLYDTNKESVENIALFSQNGELIVASPAVAQKENVNVTEEEWFKRAVSKPENVHFSNPHVQKLFVHSDYAHPRVVSLSRVVQMDLGQDVVECVLLIDIKFEWLKQNFDRDSVVDKGYLYLVDHNGEIIYHPEQQLIADGLVQENNKVASGYLDGTHNERFLKKKRIVTTKTVGYTGWKIVGVIPQQEISLANAKSIIFLIAVGGMFMLILGIVNAFVSKKVTKPIDGLEKCVREIEGGNLDAEMTVQGCYEIRHLGHAISNMRVHIKQLMEDIVKEHEIQRKNELNTLQSQINPHFLYNTLDIVVWMVENEKPSDAVKALTALARFFRIGLSKGKTIISVQDEIEHVKNYLTIQKMRYKNKFEYHIEVEEEVRQLSSLKLILQPIVENAISYGMEFKDGDGEIFIRAYLKQNEVVMEVEDNGPGILPDRMEAIRRGDVLPSKKGSGIGVKNVNERIQLSFGKQYGISLETEPDEGTKVTIRQPAVPYEENLIK